MLPPFSKTRAPRRILVVRLGAAGDLVRTIPAVKLMRRTWPDARIGWAVAQHLAPLLEGHPDVHELLLYDPRTIARELRRLNPAGIGRVAVYGRELHGFAPDLAVDFQGCLKSGLAAALSRAPVRVGFASA